jgi:LPS export ABC transporter permease LptG
MHSSPLLKFTPMIVLTVLGAALALAIVPGEAHAVEIHLLGFPDSDPDTLKLRPVILTFLCFLPALAGLCYAFAGTLDRYLARQMLGAVGLCALALMVVYVLLDVNDNINEFQKAENTFNFLVQYYIVTLPPVFVLLVPFSLMLGLLYCLGRLSQNREIVAMIQTGRGVFRVIAPLGTVGFFLSVACLCLNYHWAPWGEGYKNALIEFAKSGSKSQARNVLFVYRDAKQVPQRVWLVGSFPYNYTPKDPLRDVEIRSKDENGPTTVLKARLATWYSDTRTWAFEGAEILDIRASLEDGVIMPKFEKLPSPHFIRNYPETPWQIVKPGLNEEHLGIPELKSWLQQYDGDQWAPRRAYLTQWHYRWAQPWICLVVVLLAAPLGIVFTRRGTAGGVAIAVFLSASMLLSAEIALSLGDAGILSPALAAWGTNLVFTILAFFLLYRRLRGRPIYQALKKLLPAGD